MKLLVCTDSFEKKSVGAAHFAHFLLKINELYPQHDVRILTPDVKQSYDKVIKVTTKSYYIPKAFNFIKINFAFYRQIKKILTDESCDLVIINHPLNALLVQLRLSKKVKIGVVVHDDYSGENNHFRSLSFKHRLVFGFKKNLEKWVLSNFDLILCPSNYIKNYVEKLVNDQSKVKLLYQTIDVEAIKFLYPKEINPKLIKILFVKSNYVIGGLFDLINALSILNNYHFQLTIVGDMKTTDAEMINDAAKDFNNLILIFEYYKEKEYVSKLMYENDILCVPSKLEVLGLANVEGLAHGIRVVSTKVGGITEVLDDGKNGWLAEPNNLNSLADAIQNCIEADPSVFRTKSESGRQFVEDNFDYRNMIKRFVDICENLLNK